MPTRFRNAERLFRALGLPLLAVGMLVLAFAVCLHSGREERRSSALQEQIDGMEARLAKAQDDKYMRIIEQMRRAQNLPKSE